MSSQGPKYPGTAISDTGNPLGSSVVWVSPEQAGVDDGNYTTATVTTIDEVSEYLKCTNFGFTVPGGATIDGIVVEIDRKCDVASAFSDVSIKIVKGGTISGTDQSTGAFWPTSDTIATFGSSSNKWGLSWSASDINSSGFGVAINGMDNSVGSEVARLDFVRITVHYTSSNKQLMLLGVGP